MATKATGKKKQDNRALVLEVGAGVLAAAAAGAGYYYFYASKDAKKHRAAASAWARGLRRDVMKRAKSLKKIDAETLALIVDEAAAAYRGLREVSADDLKHASMELKQNWQHIRREINAAKRAAKAAPAKAKGKPKAAVKKAVKKAMPKKAAKKR